MKKRITPFVLAAAIILICTTVFAVGFAGARTANTDTWTGKILPKQTVDSSNVSSDLLTKNGQSVLLRNRTEEFSVPIKLTSFDGKIKGTLSANSGSAPVSLSLSETSLSLADTATKTVTLTVSPKDGFADAEGVTFGVEWRGEHETLRASFFIDNRTERAEYDSATITAPEVFLKGEPFYITANVRATLRFSTGEGVQGAFPSGTKYKGEDGGECYLYDADYITAEPGETAIDLSRAEYSGTVRITCGSVTKALTSVEPIKSSYTDRILTMERDASVDLGLPYTWEGIAPEFTIERLSHGAWESAADVTLRDISGRARLTTDGAAAGTYRLIISWSASGHVLYGEEIPFFVIH